MTVLVRRVGSKAPYESYVKTSAIWIVEPFVKEYTTKATQPTFKLDNVTLEPKHVYYEADGSLIMNAWISNCRPLPVYMLATISVTLNAPEGIIAQKELPSEYFNEMVIPPNSYQEQLFKFDPENVWIKDVNLYHLTLKYEIEF